MNVFSGARRLLGVLLLLYIAGFAALFIASFIAGGDYNEKALWRAIGIFFGGLIGLIVVSFIIGWIVRGFMGVPMWSDRPETEDEKRLRWLQESERDAWIPKKEPPPKTPDEAAKRRRRSLGYDE